MVFRHVLNDADANRGAAGATEREELAPPFPWEGIISTGTGAEDRARIYWGEPLIE